MRHAEQVRVLKELLRQVETGTNVDAGVQVRNPVDAYTCAARARREWDTFFRDHPQLVGLSGDLPATGSFFSVDDFGVPLLATRDADGRFRAFLNACRHRGSALTDRARGCAGRFVCPFHGWTYTNDGRLHGVAQQHDFGDIDRAAHGLIELPALEDAGFLWVHPQPGGTIDVAGMLGDLYQELADWHVADRVFQGEKLIEKPMNWKLANDTFGETYHFARLHRHTLGKLFHSDAQTYDVFGRNHRFVFASRGLAALKRKPESAWRTENAATVLYYLFPNIQITMSERQVTLFRIYPLGGAAGLSRTRVCHYFSTAAIAEIESGSKTVIDANNVYDPAARDGNAIISPAAAMEVLNSTLECEDYAMGQSTQRNIESGLLDYLLFGRNEPALQHFHNTFREALDLPPLTPV